MSFEKLTESGFLVRKKLAVLFLFSTAVVFAQQGKEISGKITNDKQAAMPNVTVKEEGTENTVTTDAEGNFIITLLKDQSSLSVINDGFQSQTIPVDNRSFIAIPLREDKTKTIEQVVIVGYGSVKKTDLTGSVNTLSADKIVERNTTSPLEAIQGSMPGVQITSNSGRVGDGFKMTIRGSNSLISSGNPLYVVDGVPTDNIDFLNPQDISRMDVLKDASSAAIYGSRGASGVGNYQKRSNRKRRNQCITRNFLRCENGSPFTKNDEWSRMVEFSSGSLPECQSQYSDSRSIGYFSRKSKSAFGAESQ